MLSTFNFNFIITAVNVVIDVYYIPVVVFQFMFLSIVVLFGITKSIIVTNFYDSIQL